MLLASLVSLVTSIPAMTQQSQLLIIAPDEFIDEFKPLKNFKDITGRPTLLVSLSQVKGNYTGVDDAEKVKKCIAYHAQYSGVKHVILGGDIDKFPVRWRYWGRGKANDPYFRGDWKIVNGQYEQSNPAPEKTSGIFGSWVYIGTYDQFTIEVNVTLLSGKARIYFADADRHDGKYRLDISDKEYTVVRCNEMFSTNYTFSINQTHHVKLVVDPTNLQIYLDGIKQPSYLLDQYTPLAYPTVGVGTDMGTARFDNFKVTSKAGAVLVDENFDDGVANLFNDALTMSERSWAVSELYYADLFKSGTYTFDNWDFENNGLWGEIEWKNADVYPDYVINNDNIDYLPDVSIGRIPASTEVEVIRYVNKVLAYELAVSADDDPKWYKSVALYEGSTGDGAHNNNIQSSLQNKGFTVTNRHWEGDLMNKTSQEKKDIMINSLNGGLGFVNYLGHGNFDALSCMNFNSTDVSTKLTNSGMLPIVFAGACLTGRFAPNPQPDAYTDEKNVEHAGSTHCEPFAGIAGAPNPIQQKHDLDCIAEDFLFNAGNPKGAAGAIVYLGEAREGRYWASGLAEYFFKAYSEGTTTGDMWKKAIEDYYWANNLNNSHSWNYGPEKWEVGHMFDEPQKFVLFGDPSLSVGGAFRNKLCGDMYDWIEGPLPSYSRFRVTCDVTVPVGQKLTIQAASSLLFQSGIKIMALDGNSTNGLLVNASLNNPVGLLTFIPNPKVAPVLRGMVVRGQLRVRHGGTIKFY